MYAASEIKLSNCNKQTDGLWNHILETGQIELSLCAGEPLYCQGDDADFVYEVLDGVFCCYSLLADGRRQVTDFVHRGQTIGLADKDYYNLSCDAICSAKVRSIPRSKLMKVAEEHPDLGKRLLNCATEQLEIMQQHFVLLGRKTAQERLASFLLTLAKRYAGEGAKHATFVLPMSRVDIADYLGLTIETVSRTFTKLRDAGFIDLAQSSTVHVHAILKLEELAEPMD